MLQPPSSTNVAAETSRLHLLLFHTAVVAPLCSRPRFVSAVRVSCSRRSTFRFLLLSTFPVSVPLQAHLHGCITCVLLSLSVLCLPSISAVCTFEGLGFKGMSYRVRSAGSGSGERVCKCGLIAHLKVSNSEANPRREYYSCLEGNCRWFKWAGPPVKTPVRVGGQHHERGVEESQVGMGLELDFIACSWSLYLRDMQLPVMLKLLNVNRLDICKDAL
ncbi:hypothetical protein PIB30_067263 [Stylosanthes scabra]|uniref:GRF-type domain-containing protein n=1 Tax=Stylosanthes scabra TaxID=79078 RepID=A0ABU6ULB3_9FABA|nr:hypothetical protein [Stylosanthes scabra]